jgi:inorganic pyrophosphatase
MNVGSTSVVPRTCFAGRSLTLDATRAGPALQAAQPGRSPIHRQFQPDNLRNRKAFQQNRSVNGVQMANKRAGMANPTKLKPIKKDEGLIQVVIETPKSSPNKFAFDPKQRVFALKKVLPAGMVFPYDFGFLPQTIAPDGDPIDVLLLMDEPAYPGCVVAARLIGVIEGEQLDGKKRIRNDRLLAVAEANHKYAYLKKLRDLPSQMLRELQDFFVNYHRLEGKQYKLLGCKGAQAARTLIEQAQKAA